jgi:nitroreductase
VVDDRSILLELSELESQVSSLFIQENYRYVSLTEDELIRKKTGFLSNQFPPSWLSADAQEGKVSQPAAKLGGQVRRGPVMLFVLYDPTLRAPASEGDFLGAMSLGFMLENIWLMATACGLGFQIISSLGNEPLSGEIKKILDIPPSLKLVFGCRLGYPSAEDKYRLRVCRDVEDFVHFNRYK